MYSYDLTKDLNSIVRNLDLLSINLDKVENLREYNQLKNKFDYSLCQESLTVMTEMLLKIIKPEFTKLDIFLKSQLSEQA